MKETKSVWGGAAGKVIAAFLVLGLVCGVISVVLVRAAYGEKLLSKDEVELVNACSVSDGTVSIRIRVKKPGSFLSGCKTSRDGDTFKIRLYSSLRKRAYEADGDGVYSLSFPVDLNTKKVVQEGPDGEEKQLVRIDLEA